MARSAASTTARFFVAPGCRAHRGGTDVVTGQQDQVEVAGVGIFLNQSQKLQQARGKAGRILRCFSIGGFTFGQQLGGQNGVAGLHKIVGQRIVDGDTVWLGNDEQVAGRRWPQQLAVQAGMRER